MALLARTGGSERPAGIRISSLVVLKRAVPGAAPRAVVALPSAGELGGRFELEAESAGSGAELPLALGIGTRHEDIAQQAVRGAGPVGTAEAIEEHPRLH